MPTDALLTLSVAKAAVTRLQKARSAEPDPLNATQADVVRYVTQLQQADLALAHAQDAAANSTLGAPEAALLARRRKSVDVAIATQGRLAARRTGIHRAASLATLDAIFKLGGVPEPAMHGSYRGDLLTSTLYGPLDSFGRFMARLWLPWKGKRLDATLSSGYNYLTPGGRRVGAIVWPGYRDWHRVDKRLYHALNFSTSTGPSVFDPSLTVLKLDYDLSENPGFLVRSVLDELVQVSNGYYLGKAFLRIRGEYRLAAYFTLHNEEID